MPEIRTEDLQEIKNSATERFKEIKPEGENSFKKATEYLKSFFEKSEFGGEYTSYKERCDRTPRDNSDKGAWEGARGESSFIPSETTSEGKAVKEKLAEYGLKGIEYKNGEPDFSKCAETTVKIDHMTENRRDYYDNQKLEKGNFTQADIKCAEAWNKQQKDGKTNWTQEDVSKWRDENNFVWHERCDTKTMDLAPREIHEYFKHSGGCAECKARDNTGKKDVFDAA